MPGCGYSSGGNPNLAALNGMFCMKMPVLCHFLLLRGFSTHSQCSHCTGYIQCTRFFNKKSREQVTLIYKKMENDAGPFKF